MSMNQVYSAYSDESGIFNHRYQAIGLVSGPERTLTQLRTHLQSILAENEIDEVKFEKIRTHRPQVEAARGFVKCLLKRCTTLGKVRVDVLVWDTQDSRHAIPGRDNIANLGRMYYKVLTHAARQWNQAEWNFHPDRNPQVHWNEMSGVLNTTRLAQRGPNSPSLFANKQLGQLLDFKTVEPLDSLQEPLIQLADLLAGMARFTREEGDQCVQWLDSWGNKDQPPLPNFLYGENAADETIQTKQNRFRLVGEFNALCKRHRLGVSLREKKYLRTPDPTNPINFWNYEPQHEYDKAPIRIGWPRGEM